MTRGAPEAVPLFQGARRQGRFFGFPGVPGFQRQPWGPGWSLVGDASHFKDPLSTHGITDALRDAEFLADAIGAALAGELHEDVAGTGYRAMRDLLSDELFTATDVVASYDWEPHELRPLLLALAASMREEVEVLSVLDDSCIRIAA